ncbi:hypothetical protein INS49_001754 [Diaporthe citri]|uniref:uncharacterized protein n=1 Tax=Diaporthe citri TaxID=83186 RepID=UPI001C81D63A|nr:uncharacterized protein INS49_001754 [Diaporthe citri]KAG6367561.1 hypothetical protein INS49_001754 [Diaporthe citri]
MYGGQGGKIIENFSLAVGDDRNVGDENDISTESGSPPPYDEAAAGPSAGPAGPSPGPEQRRFDKPSMKRRRPSSSPESEVALAGIRDPLSFFEGLCNKIWEERQAGFREEVFAELSRIEAQITRTVEERVSQLRDELTDQMEQADGNAVVAASDLLDEALDDKMTSIRVELEDFIRDELRDVETSIWDQLEAGTWEASFMRRPEHH